MSALTKPTRGRLVLWIVLCVFWLLLLPQELLMDPGHHQFSWLGATVWLVVFFWLACCLVVTAARIRRAR